MSCSETSRFEMSSSALVPASTTDTGDVAAVDQGLPIQNLCEVCERIFAAGPIRNTFWRILESRTPIAFQAAASRGCGICKLVIRSKTYKDEKWCIKKNPIEAILNKDFDGTFLKFAEDFSSSRVKLRLLEPQGINPEFSVS